MDEPTTYSGADAFRKFRFRSDDRLDRFSACWNSPTSSTSDRADTPGDPFTALLQTRPPDLEVAARHFNAAKGRPGG